MSEIETSGYLPEAPEAAPETQGEGTGWTGPSLEQWQETQAQLGLTNEAIGELAQLLGAEQGEEAEFDPLDPFNDNFAQNVRAYLDAGLAPAREVIAQQQAERALAATDEQVTSWIHEEAAAVGVVL